MQNACHEEKVTVEKVKKIQTSPPPPPPPTFCKMMLNCFNKSQTSRSCSYTYQNGHDMNARNLEHRVKTVKQQLCSGDIYTQSPD